jgi:hypothetical protein
MAAFLSFRIKLTSLSGTSDGDSAHMLFFEGEVAMSVAVPAHESRDGDLRADVLGWVKQKRPEVETQCHVA